MTKRFSRSKLIKELEASARDMQEAHRFNPNDGTHQLHAKRRGDEPIEDLVTRSYHYGWWRALEWIASNLRTNSIGTKD